MGGGWSVIGGFIYFWPLTVLATIALLVSLTSTEAESHEKALTVGGKRMVRSRVFLGVSCAIYYICISIGVAFKGADEPMLVLGFWVKHWYTFLALIVAAELSIITSTLYVFRARGSHNWIIQIASTLLAILSAFVTLLFLSRD